MWNAPRPEIAVTDKKIPHLNRTAGPQVGGHYQIKNPWFRAKVEVRQLGVTVKIRVAGMGMRSMDVLTKIDKQTCVSGARCQYPCLPFLSSHCYHHDNILTPAQRLTANISLPSPSHRFIFLTPSPYTPSPLLLHCHLSRLYTLYLHLLSRVFPSLALSPSLTFSSSPATS